MGEKTAELETRFFSDLKAALAKIQKISGRCLS
jgi:hypothetical protein